MTAYCSLSDLKAYMSISDSASDAPLQRTLDAASRWIDQHTGRVFSLDATDTTRLFYPGRDGMLTVPDLVSIASIKTDTTGNRTYGTTLTTSDYQVMPLDGPPYQSIRIWPQSSDSFAYDRQVQIIGKFGYTVGGAAPAEVQQANLILATRLFKRAEAPFGILQTIDLGQFTRISKEDPDVISLLAPYRVTSGAWVAV